MGDGVYQSNLLEPGYSRVCAGQAEASDFCPLLHSVASCILLSLCYLFANIGSEVVAPFTLLAQTFMPLTLFYSV